MDHGSKIVLCIHYARDGPHEDSGVVNPFKRAVEKWEQIPSVRIEDVSCRLDA
jgi:hypothetical protein